MTSQIEFGALSWKKGKLRGFRKGGLISELEVSHSAQRSSLPFLNFTEHRQQNQIIPQRLSSFSGDTLCLGRCQIPRLRSVSS